MREGLKHKIRAWLGIPSNAVLGQMAAEIDPRLLYVETKARDAAQQVLDAEIRLDALCRHCGVEVVVTDGEAGIYPIEKINPP